MPLFRVSTWMLAFASAAAAPALAAPAPIRIVWEVASEAGKSTVQERLLKEIPLAELSTRKSGTLSEPDPAQSGSKSAVRFEGVSLAALVQEATEKMTAAERSTTDLLVLKSRSGREVLMPKAFLVKYPQIQLALKANGQPLGDEAPRVVLPISSSSKIRSENVLLEPLFISSIASIALTSYEQRYASFFLRRRMDPAAIRGEKMFLQNCISCHAQTSKTPGSPLFSAEKTARVVGGSHPEAPGLQGLKALFDKKAQRSLTGYLEALRLESAKN